ncbi:CcmD family protein [Thermomicrobium sp. CFH 73360]|uniref:CcmD family protein n=1 Tax=Thermomicrobium sp. CFH 73360 TaxID=2951987 RepID=UPI002076BC05|nr:CcmD family protein [Thermomicrobium sp. CFH 73360]MCM8745092.1 CcmD family protein [Thermomicrobium sp. CFH 73360]
MDALWYLFAGFFVTWLILGIYLFSLRRQIEVLRSELAALRGERGTLEEEQMPEAKAVRDTTGS